MTISIPLKERLSLFFKLNIHRRWKAEMGVTFNKKMIFDSFFVDEVKSCSRVYFIYFSFFCRNEDSFSLWFPGTEFLSPDWRLIMNDETQQTTRVQSNYITHPQLLHLLFVLPDEGKKFTNIFSGETKEFLSLFTQWNWFVDLKFAWIQFTKK